MSIPRTLISCFIGLASCGSMGSRIVNSLWLIEVDPHRGGSISLRPVRRQWLNRQASGMRLEKVLHGLAGMIASAILNHHDVTSRLRQHVEQKGHIALGVKPPLMPFVEKPSREIVDEAEHFVAFTLATGGHFGLLACGGPGVAQRAPLGKAGFIAKEQQGFTLARVM